MLSLDPGALRCGWAVLSEGSKEQEEIQYHGSGIFGLSREGNYQEYRLRLIGYWVNLVHHLNNVYEPQVVVNEIIPPTGGTIAGIINRQLGLTVVTTVQALSCDLGQELHQISAATVKKAIGGTGKASKVKVRDGVLKQLPELESRRKEWTGAGAIYDEIDAIAVGCAWLLPKLIERANGN